MFCALNGATRSPRRTSRRHSAVAIQLLPALELVPPTKIALAIASIVDERGVRPTVRRHRIVHLPPHCSAANKQQAGHRTPRTASAYDV